MPKENLKDKPKETPRVEPALETDKFSPTEQKKIVEMIIQDAESNKKVMAGVLEIAKKDVQQYECEKPSVLENLDKENWQSDRNLGLCPAIVDTYHSTLFSTCWNPESMYFVATEENDIDNKDNIERFCKWMVGPNETNAEVEIEDYVHNRLAQGFSAFYVYWKVWDEWVDKRIPKLDKSGKLIRYEIKTEKMRFEKAVIENIADPLQDLLLPKFGKDFQSLKQFIHIVYISGSEMLDFGKDEIFMNVDEELIDKIKDQILTTKRENETSQEKKDKLGIGDVSDSEVSDFPINLYAWYGYYKKGKRREKYRFYVEPLTQTFLAGKPLRKITRTGKYPFVGGAFIRRPGLMLGKSLIRLISPIINAFNNIFNQISDFQYVENCPFGFFKPDENYQKQEYKLIPGVLYPSETPKDVYFPNLSRSMAWAYDHIRLLFEVLEKLTGAASYFMSNERGTSATATRDRIIEEKSETRFGRWVTRLQAEISEAITMCLGFYQDWAPPKLGTRILGKEGKQLFKNLSINSLRGNYDCRMKPDVVAGSKALDRQVKLWGFENLSQTVWLDPRVNPKGNWNLVAEAAKAIGFTDVERYLGPEPPAQVGTSQEVEDEFTRMAQGEVVELRPNENPMEHYFGHMKQKQEKYFDLDEEYRPNFDKHLFHTMAEFYDFIRKMQMEKVSDMLALKMLGGTNAPGVQGQVQPGVGQPANPAQRPGMAGVRQPNAGTEEIPPITG